METQHLKISDEVRKYRVKIAHLEKENQELKSQNNSCSPNNITLIKNLQNVNKKLKKDFEKIKCALIISMLYGKINQTANYVKSLK